jgi:hypothetical protein
MVDVDPYDGERRRDIASRMSGAAGWLTNTSVASSLVKLVEEHCDGVVLRQSGGVYWVREDRLDEWTQIADVFEMASAKGDKEGEEVAPNAIYALKVVGDEQMVRAVGDCLTDDVLGELTRIESEVADGNLKEGACLSRLRNVGAFEAKVKRYEDAFSTPLNTLQDAVRRASTAVAQATILASAGSQAARQGV